MTQFRDETWEAISAIVRRVVRQRLRFAPEDDVGDVASEAIAATYFASLEKELVNLEAFATSVARYTVIGYIRRRKVAATWISALPDDVDDIPESEPAGLPSESAEWLLFLVASRFEQEKPECVAILELFRQDVEGWSAKAKILGSTVGAVKERWSRCCASFRRWAAAQGIRPFAEPGAE